MEKITSRSNEIIKDVKKLFTSRRFRAATGRFALEGARLCFDCLESGCPLLLLLVTQSALERYGDKCAPLIEKAQRSVVITDELSSHIADTKNPQGVFAVCAAVEKSFEPRPGAKYIALDNIQDPANLGAVIRTAEALGIDGALAGGGCDIYNPKALRASMGGALRFPVFRCEDLAAELERLSGLGFHTYAAVPDPLARDIKSVRFSGSDICVIGNEGSGVSPQVLCACEQPVTINMLGRAESLNASVAAAIVMWEMLS